MVYRLLAFIACVMLLFGSLMSTQVSAQSPGAVQSMESKSTRAVLIDSWQQYKKNFIQADGRVIDHNGNVTTSEGQSYAMLRAFWMRDRDTFDRVWHWTVSNLQTRGDSLLAWKWGQKQDGTWGILDQTSATDADQDVALALLLAHQVWQDPIYKEAALPILADIWNRLTAETPIGRILLPGDWPAQAHGSRSFQINPSYFAPYAYRVFSEADPDHDWDRLIDTSYEILQRSMSQTRTQLPPDWVMVSREDDNITLYMSPNDNRSDYGYEAIRVFWRIAVDVMLNPLEKRGQQVLGMTNPLPRYWEVHHSLPGSLTWDGIPRQMELVSGAPFGAVLPSLNRQNPATAKAVIEQKIIPNLQPGAQWNTPNDYYTQNWLWLGLAWYNTLSNPPVTTKRDATAKLAEYFKL